MIDGIFSNSLNNILRIKYINYLYNNLQKIIHK